MNFHQFDIFHHFFLNKNLEQKQVLYKNEGFKFNLYIYHLFHIGLNYKFF